MLSIKCICLQIERETAPPPEGEAGEGKKEIFNKKGIVK